MFTISSLNSIFFEYLISLSLFWITGFILKIDSSLILSVENDINTQFWGKIEYSRSGGIHIPLPFLRDLNLNNTVSFSFNADFESSKKLVGYQQIESRSELTLDDSSSKLSFTPKMSYQFSQWVSGNIFFKYILSNDINTGERVERDFGFNLTIQIRG